MADDEQRQKQDEKDRKKAEGRAPLKDAAQAKKGEGKKGFRIHAGQKKLRTLLRKKAAEEMQKEQERKVEERKRTIADRCGTATNLDGINEAALQAICKEYQQRIAGLEDAKYDLEYAVRQKEFVINELTMQVNYVKGKFSFRFGPQNGYEKGKFEKLTGAAKKQNIDFRANLKSVDTSTKFKIDDVRKVKPDWALGAKKKGSGEE